MIVEHIFLILFKIIYNISRYYIYLIYMMRLGDKVLTLNIGNHSTSISTYTGDLT